MIIPHLTNHSSDEGTQQPNKTNKTKGDITINNVYYLKALKVTIKMS